MEAKTKTGTKPQKKLSGYFESIYRIKGKTSDWKWKHGDLAIRMWFQDFGKSLSFDNLVVLEWDLLLFGSLVEIYGHIPKRCVGLTGPTLTTNVENKWMWLYKEPSKSEWEKLKSYVTREYGYKGDYFATLGPGSILPYSFLEKYSSVDVPELGHDELRLPLFVKALGFDLCDTGFFKKWFDDDEPKYFNAWDEEIKLETIKEELKKDDGRRVFHPFRKIYYFKKD